MIGGGHSAKALSLSGNPVEESTTVCKHLRGVLWIRSSKVYSSLLWVFWTVRHRRAARGLIDASTFWKTLLKSYILSILLTTGLIVRVRASAAFWTPSSHSDYNLTSPSNSFWVSCQSSSLRKTANTSMIRSRKLSSVGMRIFSDSLLTATVWYVYVKYVCTCLKDSNDWLWLEVVTNETKEGDTAVWHCGTRPQDLFACGWSGC